MHTNKHASDKYTNINMSDITPFLLFISIRRWILAAEHPLIAARKFIPIYLILVGIILALMTMIKGFNHFQVELSLLQKTGVVAATTIVVLILGLYGMKQFWMTSQLDRRIQYVYIEGMFSVLMAFTACAALASAAGRSRRCRPHAGCGSKRVPWPGRRVRNPPRRRPRPRASVRLRTMHARVRRRAGDG